jgi:ubiquinone/menaquinone biosynthesis C-methylase UbiE
MSERQFSFHDADVHSELQYGRGPSTLDARANLYKYAVHPFNVREEINQALGLGENGNKEAVVADIACGNASYTMDLAQNHQHTGRLININYPRYIYEGAEEMALALGLNNVEFMELDARLLVYAEETGIADSSVDKAAFQFAPYHMENVDEAFKGIKRILKPGGQLAVATRGDHNQIRLWQKTAGLHGLIAPPDKKYRYLTPNPPDKSYYHKFDLTDAEARLAQFFHIDYVRMHESYLKFPTPTSATTLTARLRDYGSSQAWLDYTIALNSLGSSYFPPPRGKDLERAIERYIAPQVAKEIEANLQQYGEPFFTDYWQEGFIICTNEKDGYKADPAEKTKYFISRPEIKAEEPHGTL